MWHTFNIKLIYRALTKNKFLVIFTESNLPVQKLTAGEHSRESTDYAVYKCQLGSICVIAVQR